MEDKPNKHERWPLIRQAIIFQLKLGLDALRDVLLSPASIILVVADILLANSNQQSYFRRLMLLGQKSDRWINLFAVAPSNKVPEDAPKDTADNHVVEDSNVDDWFSKIEEVIKEQQVDGKLSQSSKEKLQQYLGLASPPSDKQ